MRNGHLTQTLVSVPSEHIVSCFLDLPVPQFGTLSPR
jgi:hypothetical protein